MGGKQEKRIKSMEKGNLRLHMSAWHDMINPIADGMIVYNFESREGGRSNGKIQRIYVSAQ